MIKLRKILRKINKIWLKLEKIILIVVILELSFPQISLAKELEKQQNTAVVYELKQNQVINNEETKKLPIINEIKPRYKSRVLATAYNSLPNQTDASPCITASGLNVCKRNQEDIIAANFLPFGTKIKIPKLYGDRIFYVQDRMNKKYSQRIDVWLKNYSEAKKFGCQYVEIEVY